jgi:hypothetical protein
MRLYDIALMLMRATAAIEFMRGLASVVRTAIRFAFLTGVTGGSAWVDRVELSFWLTPAYSLCLAAAFLVFSRPMARFAARLSGHGEIASSFE